MEDGKQNVLFLSSLFRIQSPCCYTSSGCRRTEVSSGNDCPKISPVSRSNEDNFIKDTLSKSLLSHQTSKSLSNLNRSKSCTSVASETEVEDVFYKIAKVVTKDKTLIKKQKASTKERQLETYYHPSWHFPCHWWGRPYYKKGPPWATHQVCGTNRMKHSPGRAAPENQGRPAHALTRLPQASQSNGNKLLQKHSSRLSP